MAAYYDTYDYPSYWEGREYEHQSELIALKAYLDKIPKIKSILDLGAGYGRLTPAYSFRAKKVVLVDASAKILKVARDRLDDPKTIFLQSRIENLPKKLRRGSFDLVICIRVAHHMPHLEKVVEISRSLLKKNGFFIFEFANKGHLKATFQEFIKGNFTFPIDIFPQDKRSKRSMKLNKIPFYNYHPDAVYELLHSMEFRVIEKRSVSNVRSSFLKNTLPQDLLLGIEKALQKPFSYINFGPSIFILAQKLG